MVIGKPEASSTPTAVPQIRGRKGVRDRSSIQSPIDWSSNVSHSPSLSPKNSPSVSPRSVKFRARSADYESDSEETENDETGNKSTEESFELSEKDTTIIHWGPVVIIISLILVVLMALLGQLIVDSEVDASQELKGKFAKIEKRFDRQDEDFWRSIRVNIEEISALRKPSTIIFVYDNNAEGTMKDILSIVTNIAMCHLSDCANEPIYLSGAMLRSLYNTEDYGTIISTYRAPLTSSGVLVVENLEQVPGKAAQAFHSFCDDYDPVVHRALILFTLKVDKLPEDEMPTSYVRKLLSQKWGDIDTDDKFNPLFARISGTILLVQPE